MSELNNFVGERTWTDPCPFRYHCCYASEERGSIYLDSMQLVIKVVILGIEVRFVLSETNVEPLLEVKALVGKAVGPEHRYV